MNKLLHILTGSQSPILTFIINSHPSLSQAIGLTREEHWHYLVARAGSTSSWTGSFSLENIALQAQLTARNVKSEKNLSFQCLSMIAACQRD